MVWGTKPREARCATNRHRVRSLAAGLNQCKSAETVPDPTGRSLGLRELWIGQGSQKEFPPGLGEPVGGLKYQQLLECQRQTGASLPGD